MSKKNKNENKKVPQSFTAQIFPILNPTQRVTAKPLWLLDGKKRLRGIKVADLPSKRALTGKEALVLYNDMFFKELFL